MKKIIISSIMMLLASTFISYAQDLSDSHTYPVTGNGEQLRNIFLKSAFNSGGNVFVSGVSGGDSRGFVEKNGKLYFANRKSNTAGSYGPQIIEVDGATGSLLETYDLPEALYTGLTYPANDIAIDNAGNIFISNMITTTGEFRITYIDLSKTPLQGETILSATLSGRYETFEVFGDIRNGDGFILVPKSSSNIISKYNVANGTLNPTAEEITISQFYPNTITSFGQSPRLHIISKDRFYADGVFSDPVLYDMSGSAIDGFQNNTALAPTNMEPRPDGADKRGGANGVTEFELNGQHYLIVASSNTDFVTPQQFDLFQFKDDNKQFSEMTFLYRFPNAGMGRLSNGIASISHVKILNNGTEDKARIYIHAFKNGYGIYDLVTNVTEEPENPEFDWLEAPAIVIEGTDAKVVGPNAVNFTKFFVNGSEVTFTNRKADLSELTGNISLKATTDDGEQIIRLKINK